MVLATRRSALNFPQTTAWVIILIKNKVNKVKQGNLRGE